MGGDQRQVVSGMAKGILLAGAAFDFLFSVPVALPPVAAGYIDWLHAVNASLGDPLAKPEFGPIELIFANMFGAVMCIWAIGRVLQPSADLAFYDMWIRLAITSIFASYALTGTAPVVMYFFMLLDIVLAVANYWACRNWHTPSPVANTA